MKKPKKRFAPGRKPNRQSRNEGRDDAQNWRAAGLRGFFLFWRTSKFGALVWPLIFWGWVVWVSLWIDQASTQQFESSDSLQSYSDIRFQAMRFEQKYNDNTQLAVESARAWFDPGSQTLYLDKPLLRWSSLEDERSFSARAERGELQSRVDESSLPSEFQILRLFGDGRAEGNESSVLAEAMLFDCDTKQFRCPPPSVFTQGGLTLQNQQAIIFFPLEGRMESEG